MRDNADRPSIQDTVVSSGSLTVSEQVTRLTRAQEKHEKYL